MITSTATRDQSGFTLIEAVVAFAILALFLAAMLPSLSSSLSGSRAGADTLIATAYAQSLVDGVGAGGTLAPGEFHNTLENPRFASLLTVRPYSTDQNAGDGPMLYEVRASISWHNGSQMRRVSLDTLRFGVAK